MQRVEDIRKKFAVLFENGIVAENETIELVGQSFVADEPAIFGKPNEDYIKREIDWYKSQSLNVNDIEGKIPKIWQQVSGKNGEINSNYGWCIFSSDNYYQFQNVFETLSKDIYSRQAVMIYTRPTMHYDAYQDGMKDFMCTNTVQYLFRNNVLDCVVNMRSNDAVYGYKNDYAWQKFVLNTLADVLEVKPGFIFWQTGSLHIYPRHFYLLGDYES